MTLQVAQHRCRTLCQVGVDGLGGGRDPLGSKLLRGRGGCGGGSGAELGDGGGRGRRLDGEEFWRERRRVDGRVGGLRGEGQVTHEGLCVAGDRGASLFLGAEELLCERDVATTEDIVGRGGPLHQTTVALDATELREESHVVLLHLLKTNLELLVALFEGLDLLPLAFA
jgi:hypothetical protein